MNKPTLTPALLRVILSITLVLLFLIGIGIFLLGYKRLGVVNTDAQAVAAKARDSQSSINRLMTTKKMLQDNSATIDRANQLVSQSRSYVYQDQIISDINKYATESGISITDISFTDSKTTAVGGSSAGATTGGSASTAASTGATAAAPMAGAGATPAGIKSMTAQVSIANPTSYSSMLTFIHLIEQSLFRMQVSKISLSRGEAAGGDQISSNALTIEVFVR